MTTKEQIELRQKTRELSEDVKEVIADLMNQRALQVATEAVEEAKQRAKHTERNGWDYRSAKINIDNVLKNIKKRLDAES